MKILSLNCWGGRIRPDIYEFIRKYRDEVDVFCLQEVFNDPGEVATPFFSDDGDLSPDPRMYDTISSILVDHNLLFAPCLHNLYGIALFVRKTLRFSYQDYQVAWPDQFEAFENLEDHARKIQILSLNTLSIVNFHGLWAAGTSKNDTTERIVQSEKINRILSALDRPFVILGDFNLNPDTESLAILTKWRRELIREYDILSTRTSLYLKKQSLFADYAIVSNDIVVKDFRVLPDVVSDHTPLLLTL